MGQINFSKIAARYEDHSLVQRSAADLLLDLLEIEESDDVLDLGCGVGNLTGRIREMTGGRVVGIDPSEGMIKEAVERNQGLNIIFETKGVEELDYVDSFDVIFCNSVFQWFRDPKNAIKNCYASLRKGGRIGVQAPAKQAYSPNFIEAVDRVKEDPETEEIFAHFNEPWFFLETGDEYGGLFENCGFRIVLSRISSIRTEHTPDEVFNIFSSGAAAGYLNQDFYDIPIGADYVEPFGRIVKDAFLRQADRHGKLLLIFNRIFLVAIKE